MEQKIQIKFKQTKIPIKTKKELVDVEHLTVAQLKEELASYNLGYPKGGKEETLVFNVLRARRGIKYTKQKPTKFKVVSLNNQVPFTKNLDETAQVRYIPNFLDNSEQKHLFDYLNDLDIWHRPVETMWGKEVTFPRDLAAMCNEDLVGLKYCAWGDGAVIWTPEMKIILEKVQKEMDTIFTFCEMNRYIAGSDRIGWHKDREMCIGDPICALSLGVERKFALRPDPYKDMDNPPKYEITLSPGSLFVMNYEACNGPWKHAIIETTSDVGTRISITFRPKCKKMVHM